MVKLGDNLNDDSFDKIFELISLSEDETPLKNLSSKSLIKKGVIVFVTDINVRSSFGYGALKMNLIAACAAKLLRKRGRI